MILCPVGWFVGSPLLRYIDTMQNNAIYYSQYKLYYILLRNFVIRYNKVIFYIDAISARYTIAWSLVEGLASRTIRRRAQLAI